LLLLSPVLEDRLKEKGPEGESMFRKYLLRIALCAISLVTAASATTLAKQIDVPGTPIGIAVNPLNNRVYVTQNNVDEESAVTYISMIDGATNAVINTIQGPDDLLSNIAVDVVTGRVYLVACRTLQVAEVTCLLAIYDSSLNWIASVADVAAGSPLAVNPITHRLYYARQSVSGVAVLNTQTNAYLGRIRLGASSPGALDIDLSENHVFAVYAENRVAVIDAHTSTVLRTTSVGVDDSDVAVDAYRHRLYVTNFNRESTSRSTVAVLNSDTLALQKKVLVGVNPSHVAVDTFTGTVFVTNDRFHTLYVINGNTEVVTQKLTGPRGPVDVNPNTKFVYTGTATVYVDPVTGKVDVISE
jgi:DNA-binding beta-propeller fold protein YncE